MKTVIQREKVNNENKNKTHIDPKQSTPLHKNADNASTKQNADTSEDNSSISSHDFNSKCKKSIVILGDSMLKDLNSWGMSKKVKSDCKIFVKHFSGKATNFVNDYLKPSLRKHPNHIILHVGTNDLIIDRTSQETAISMVNLDVIIGEVKKEILKLGKTKASQKTDIPTRTIKENIDIFVDFLCTSIKSAIKSSSFPSSLKLADVRPVHNKGRKNMKENFRPVSILPTLSKMFE